MANLVVDGCPCLPEGFGGGALSSTIPRAGTDQQCLTNARTRNPGIAADPAMARPASPSAGPAGVIGFVCDPAFYVCWSEGPHACPLPHPARCMLIRCMITSRPSEM